MQAHAWIKSLGSVILYLHFGGDFFGGGGGYKKNTGVGGIYTQTCCEKTTSKASLNTP